MLARAQAHTNQVSPRGDEAAVSRAWQEWDETIAAIRMLLVVPEAWSTHFTTGMRNMLTPAERLAIPGGGNKPGGLEATVRWESLG